MSFVSRRSEYASVDGQVLGRYPAGLLRRDEQHHIRDFFHRPGTRLHPLHLRERLYHARIAPREVGVDGTRRYRVDSNTVAVAELNFFFLVGNKIVKN